MENISNVAMDLGYLHIPKESIAYSGFDTWISFESSLDAMLFSAAYTRWNRLSYYCR